MFSMMPFKKKCKSVFVFSKNIGEYKPGCFSSCHCMVELRINFISLNVCSKHVFLL